MKNIIDVLIESVKEKQNPTVIGLDPTYEMLPEYIKKKYPQTIEGTCEGLLEFNKLIIDEIYDIIPAVKPQMAFYEALGVKGIEVFEKTCKYAKQKGLIIICDAKRGDIGTTAERYSSAFLGKTKIGNVEENIFDVDFLTVNPYLGLDGITPFIEDCKKYNKGIFILAKTSNKSSGDIQDLKLENGKTIYETVVNLVNMWGKDLVGENGYSSIGVVVGATYPEQLEEIRKLLPNGYFLIPGFGAQGGKAEDIARGFDKNGLGGIVNASRSLICAYKSDKWKDKYSEKEFAKATRAEALDMKEKLNKYIGG